MSSFTSKLAAAVLKPKLMVLKDKMDYSSMEEPRYFVESSCH